jgi:hypothetical protein
MHLAGALGKPVVSLFFCTHFVETGPYGPGHIAIHPDLPCYPCQGTAKCLHKTCLDHISWESVAAAVSYVLDGKNITGEGSLGTGERMERLYISIYDPWGYLDWQPADGRRIAFEDIEKLLLKTAWLDLCGIISDVDETEAKYLSDVLKRYDTSEEKTNILDRMVVFGNRLADFRQLLEQALQETYRLQSLLLDNGSDRSAIKAQGKRLQKVEEQISSFDTNSAFGFLSELLNSLRENIAQTSAVTLTLKTAEVYRNIIQMTEAIRIRSGQWMESISVNA